ncbi:hypothetical protein G9A89_021099 [Geosiphon pyriformis]|nr:hypothetical protein G9A89_021099 [Geosiphon pyriformis]
MEKTGLIGDNGVVSDLSSSIVFMLSAGVVHMFGVIESFAIRFDRHKLCHFFFGLDGDAFVTIGDFVYLLDPSNSLKCNIIVIERLFVNLNTFTISLMPGVNNIDIWISVPIMITKYGSGVNGIFMVNGAMSPAEDTQAERYYIFIKK